jgi:hypothetical protein
VALRAQWLRSDPLARGMAFASIMGIVAIMIHSWVDFNLQIPANAQLFVVLMAFGWTALYLERKNPPANPPSPAPDMRTPVLTPVDIDATTIPDLQDGKPPQPDPG